MESQKERDSGAIEVDVLYVPTSRSKSFPIEKNATLERMFEKAYHELGEQKRSGDKYYCKNGFDLSNELSHTVESVIKDRCKGSKFEIRNQTGGATTHRLS